MGIVIRNGIFVGLALLGVSLVFNTLLQAIFPSLAAEFANTTLFRPWSDPVMLLYFVYPFILGLGLAYAWEKTRVLITRGSVYTRGTQFGIAYWLIAVLPGMVVSYSSFPISLLMVLSWALSGLIDAMVAGVLLARMRS